MKKLSVQLKLDPLGIKTGLELVVGGILATLVMRWLGM